MTDHLQIAIPLFPKFTALDAVGPYEVLQRIPDFDIVFLGHSRGEVRSENDMIGLSVDASFEEVPAPDVVVFPGGIGTRALEHDERVLEWVRRAHARHPVHHVGLHRFAWCSGRPACCRA